jgi:hypothetical protein
MAWGAKKTEHAGAKQGRVPSMAARRTPSVRVADDDAKIEGPSSTPNSGTTREGIKKKFWFS